MLIGLVGKPNVGKSTLFTAATQAPAEIANYPFTTIEPNRGVAYVRTKCPHVELGLERCDPRTGACHEGTRFIPVEVLDVAGLVPDAHTGKGLGNKFLDNLREADVLVHVVDATGSTDAEGNPVPAGTRDPEDDIRFLERELDHWIGGIIAKGFDRAARGSIHKGDKLERVLADRLTGLRINEHDISRALMKVDMPEKATDWTEADCVRLASILRQNTKPIVLALNKADAAAPDALEAVLKAHPEAIPASANTELALRKAADAGVVRYHPGDPGFELVDEGKLNAAQRKGLEYMREHVFARYRTTGVQDLLERSVYKHLDRVVAFPVEDETHCTDKDGRVLPDAHLMPRGSTAKQLAYRVHTELGDHFIRAVNAKTKRVVGADYEVQDGDVLRIVSAK